MAEEKETEFKVTDRRKFNADGSPREQADEPAPAANLKDPEPARQSPPPADDAPAGNVVSFPGDASKKREQAAAAAAPPEAPPEAAGAQEDSARAAAAKAAASAAEQAYNQMKPAGGASMSEPSFLSLIDMLAGEAAMCLGLAQTPDGSRLPVDLEAARAMIDMLGMLKQKTEGNLNPEESGVLENVLGYLRMQFVALSRNR